MSSMIVETQMRDALVKTINMFNDLPHETLKFDEIRKIIQFARCLRKYDKQRVLDELRELLERHNIAFRYANNVVKIYEVLSCAYNNNDRELFEKNLKEFHDAVYRFGVVNSVVNDIELSDTVEHFFTRVREMHHILESR